MPRQLLLLPASAPGSILDIVSFGLYSAAGIDISYLIALTNSTIHTSMPAMPPPNSPKARVVINRPHLLATSAGPSLDRRRRPLNQDNIYQCTHCLC